jgi:5,10-methylene-tetrahydrofolate dehydrogenase/methenyl tetrahydrofolate cyclohydrolase
VVLVGSRKDSETYVRSKKKACAEVRVLCGVLMMLVWSVRGV